VRVDARAEVRGEARRKAKEHVMIEIRKKPAKRGLPPVA
jgi:hypothetical protein